MSASNARLEVLVRSLRPCRVAVIGDVMLDRYIHGKVRRLSPEAPIQVLEVSDEEAMPGGAANVAMKVVELGSRVVMVGLVGEDAPASVLRGLIAARDGMTDGLLADPDRATTEKTRLIAQNQQLLRVDRERRDDPSPRIRALLAEAARQAAAEADVVILEDYGKGVLCDEIIAAALEGARQSNAPVLVDPNGRNYRRYAGATVLTPNLRETEQAAERPISGPGELEAAAAALVDQTEGSALAVTRESEGISLFERQADGAISHTHVPTVPVEVYDVTGAGDAVAAAMAIALASGIELAEACALANLAGRAVVRQHGVGVISIAHLIDETAEIPHRANKILDRDRARERVKEIRRAGGKVVFTNGCFDILHYGHVHLLQYARSQGDCLVLGLNTDASTRRLKGPERPFVDEDQRSYMLSLYPFVDLVVLFDEETPAELIEALRPDVIVKGGDYTPDTVVGRDLIESYGGKVVICPRLDGLSTTDLVRKIQSLSDSNPAGVVR